MSNEEIDATFPDEDQFDNEEQDEVESEEQIDEQEMEPPREEKPVKISTTEGGGAIPIQFRKGNYICPACKAGPFEGPRALAKHEGRMHRLPQRLSQLPSISDPLNEPMPMNAPQVPMSPIPAQVGHDPTFDAPERPLDLSPHSEFSERVDQSLAELGYNTKDWFFKRRIIKKTLSRLPGYNTPSALKSFLYSVGVRPDHLDIIAMEALGTDGVQFGAMGAAMPPPQFSPYGQPAPPPGYGAPPPQGYPYPPPYYPQPRESEFDRFLSMLGKMKELGVVQVGPAGAPAPGSAPPWAAPTDYFQSLMAAFKSGKEAIPSGSTGNETLVREMAQRTYDMQNNIIQSLINRPSNEGERAAVIREMREMGLLAQPQSLEQLIDQGKKLKELGLVGVPENIEAMRVQKDLSLEMKKMELEHAKMLHELKKEDASKLEQKEQFESLKGMAVQALETIGKPLSQAVGEGMKAQIRAQQQAAESLGAEVPREQKLAQLRLMKQRIEQAEKQLGPGKEDGDPASSLGAPPTPPPPPKPVVI